MNILIAPNAFKGSLSSHQAAECIARGFLQSGLDCRIDLMPIADGGDDTMEVLCSPRGRVVGVEVVDPLGRTVKADFGIMADGRTAVVEMARSSGLKLLRPEEYDPLRASTFGVGQLILAAADQGVDKIVIGVGGSATVDAGAGFMAALGVILTDERGRQVPLGGGSLGLIRDIDPSGVPDRVRDIEFVVACDVENPALGPNGAATVFGPQKGASPEEVVTLEANLAHFLGLVEERLGIDVRDVPRGGAAGALAAGAAALLGARLESGADLILDHLGAVNRIADADLVITGEGFLDAQTLQGKGPQGLVRIARTWDRPVVALTGGVADNESDLVTAGFSAVLPITTQPMGLEEAMARAPEMIERAAERLGRLLILGGSL